jgi:hypothetical protein
LDAPFALNMRRRIIYIILGSLFLLALIVGLWWWFFGRTTTTPETQNLFDSSQDKNDTGGKNGTGNNNGQSPLGTNTGTNSNGSTGSVPLDQGGVNAETPLNGLDSSDGNNGSSGNNGSNDTGFTPSEPPPDVIWTSPGGGPTGTNITLNSPVYFNPTTINQVTTTDITGKAHITKILSGGKNGQQIDLTEAGIAVAILGCVAQHALSHLAALGSGTVAAETAASLATEVQAHSASGDASSQGTQIADCLARSIGHIAVQKLVDSTVDWINGGFNGKPAFVQDFNKYFADVADQAAGNFLQNSKTFAFLCSPFQLQVRIAIAQAYARRNGDGGGSCTLSSAIGNVNNFVNGTFSKGGWQGLLAFTTEPSNNPFAGFMSLDVSLHSTIGNAQLIGDKETKDGYLPQKKCTQVMIPSGNSPQWKEECKTVTLATQIDDAGASAIGESFRQLEVGDGLTQILNALENALVNKIMQGPGGFAGANTDAAINTTDPKAQTQANALMRQLTAAVNLAQRYAGVEQSMISDIENTQSSLTDMENCWILATSSQTITQGQLDQANANQAMAAAKISQLQAQVDQANNRIQRANNSITRIQGLQTDLLLASLASDVTRVQNRWNALKASNTFPIYEQTDVTSANQDRTTLQNNLDAMDADTSTKLNQCHGISGQ